MMTKIKKIASKNLLLGLLIKTFCFIAFFLISSWNEFMGWLRIHRIGWSQYKSLIGYKKKFSGKRCFIIAMGPSITMEDLNKLKNEYTFGMNSICKIYSQTDFRPTFYGIQDFYVYGDIQEYIEKNYSDNENVFISDRVKWHFGAKEKWNVFPLNMSYNAYKRWFNDIFEVKFSDDIYRRVYDGFSITMSLIQIAIYMGFKEIYLIGADCNFEPEKKLHFVDHNNSIDATLNTAAERNFAGYRAAKIFADNNGVSIYNATRGGKLEIFERVNLDDLF